MKKLNYFLVFILLGLLIGTSVTFTSCTDDDDDMTPEDTTTVEPNVRFSPADSALETRVQEAFITMADGDTIEFAAGTFNFTTGLTIRDKNNIVIRGAGLNETTFSFAGQTVGAEGVLATNMNQFIIADLTVEDAKGDGIKVKDSDGVSFIRVGAIWTGEANEQNGAYGLYPVKCTNVLIDGSLARGASDAGLYVGQCQKVIVRNSTAENNVAGIEIENTLDADVYNNRATNNTGGLLIFALPNLTINQVARVRAYDNMIIDNNYRNFAPAGNIVGNVPPGTGIMILSAKDVECFNNTITNNNVMGVGVINYEVLEFFDSSLSFEDEEYDPFPTHIHVHDNTFSRQNEYADAARTHSIGVLLTGQYPDGDMPDILFDGIVKTDATEADRICFQNNGDARVVNLDVENFFANKDEDPEFFNCNHAPLPVVEVDAPTLP